MSTPKRPRTDGGELEVEHWVLMYERDMDQCYAPLTTYLAKMTRENMLKLHMDLEKEKEFIMEEEHYFHPPDHTDKFVDGKIHAFKPGTGQRIDYFCQCTVVS